MEATYVGLYNDQHGLTPLGRIVRDAWLFGLIPETEDCRGWTLSRMQQLKEKVEAEWDKYAGLPSRLPPELYRRHEELYARAIVEARARGWDPELGEDD